MYADICKFFFLGGQLSGLLHRLPLTAYHNTRDVALAGYILDIFRIINEGVNENFLLTTSNITLPYGAYSIDSIH